MYALEIIKRMNKQKKPRRPRLTVIRKPQDVFNVTNHIDQTIRGYRLVQQLFYDPKQREPFVKLTLTKEQVIHEIIVLKTMFKGKQLYGAILDVTPTYIYIGIFIKS